MEVVTEQPTPNTVPEGYKRTEFGIIPDDWIVKEFGNITKPSNLRISANNTDRNIKCIELEHIQQGTGQVDGYSNLQDQKSTKTIFSKGDVLFGKLRPYLRKFHCAEFDGACSTEIWVFPKGDGVDNKYLYYIVQLDSFIEASNKSTGTHMPRADWDVVKEHPIALPPTLEEQHAIAEALSDVDALIAELDALIKKKQQVKKGAMQQLLTGKKRLPGFDGEWEENTVGEILDLGSNKTYPERENEEIECIELEHIEQGTGKLLGSTNIGQSKSSKSLFKKYDVLFSKLRPYLRKYWLADRSGVCSTEIWVLKAKDNKVIPSFLYYLVQTDDFIEAANVSTGTHMPRADWDIVKDTIFEIPSKKEQKNIAKILSDMDAEIQTLQSKREKYEQIKQGMMQELLTGKTRLV